MSQLTDLEKEYNDQLQTGRAQDPEFASAVLKRIAPHKARAELREIHSMLRSRHPRSHATQATGWSWTPVSSVQSPVDRTADHVCAAGVQFDDVSAPLLYVPDLNIDEHMAE